MGYVNPLLNLPAGKALLLLPAKDRQRIENVMRQLRTQANAEAERSWQERKGPMACYWRAVTTYARHPAHALFTADASDASSLTFYSDSSGEMTCSRRPDLTCAN